MTNSELEIRGHTQTHVSLFRKQYIYRGYSREQFNLAYLADYRVSIAQKTLKKPLKIKTFLAFKLSDVVFILLVSVYEHDEVFVQLG